jgi:DNA mismatch endonuclease, patch repair protein
LTDILTPEGRSRMMRRIGRANTKPEVVIRRLLFSLGFRFRLHSKSLPGRPDIVLPKYKAVVFVNGCFWHHHHGCPKAYLPKTRAAWWKKKLLRNVERDLEVERAVLALGWRVLTLWECDLDSDDRLKEQLSSFLRRPLREAQ